MTGIREHRAGMSIRDILLLAYECLYGMSIIKQTMIRTSSQQTDNNTLVQSDVEKYTHCG